MSEIRIVFDGPPGPEAGRFVEVEDADGCSISRGDWRPIEGTDLWGLYIEDPTALRASVEEWEEKSKTWMVSELVTLRARVEEMEQDLAVEKALLAASRQTSVEYYQDLSALRAWAQQAEAVRVAAEKVEAAWRDDGADSKDIAAIRASLSSCPPLAEAGNEADEMRKFHDPSRLHKPKVIGD